nr:reverse transcriptase domain-containing protein [Tanacetum cinerariifolium]
MFDRLIREIRGFTQQHHESLVGAWLRMKDLLRRCHGHGLGRGTIIQIFYHGLDEPTQAILDAGGIFLYKNPNEAHQLLEDRVLFKLDFSKENKAKPIRKTIDLAKSIEHSPLLQKMEALTKRINSQFKEIKRDMKETRGGCNKCGGPHPSLDCDDKPKRTQGTYDPPVNPNAKPAIFLDDSENEADEVMKEAEPLPKKPTYADPPPLKAYKPNISYFKCLHKEKMEAQYAKFLDMIKEVRNNVPLVDVLAVMPNYGKLLKDLVSNKAALSGTNLKPTRMSILLANHTYQYPMGVPENMLVQVGKFMFPAGFVILQMEEDDKVPLILGRPFLHTADAIIRVENKELSLGTGEDRVMIAV